MSDCGEIQSQVRDRSISASENEVDQRQNNSSASVITSSSAEEQETYYHFPYGGIVYRSGSDPNN